MSKGIFSTLAELVKASAEQEFERLFNEKLDELEKQIKAELEVFFQQARKEARKRANLATVQLLQDADVSGFQVRITI